MGRGLEAKGQDRGCIEGEESGRRAGPCHAQGVAYGKGDLPSAQRRGSGEWKDTAQLAGVCGMERTDPQRRLPQGDLALGLESRSAAAPARYPQE